MGPGGVKTALIKLSPRRQFISKPLVQREDQNSQSASNGQICLHINYQISMVFSKKNSDLSLHCWTERFKLVIHFGWYFRSITRGIVSQVAINVTVSRPPPLQLHKIQSSQEILFPMMSCGMTSQVFLFVQTTYTTVFENHQKSRI